MNQICWFSFLMVELKFPVGFDLNFLAVLRFPVAFEISGWILRFSLGEKLRRKRQNGKNMHKGGKNLESIYR